MGARRALSEPDMGGYSGTAGGGCATRVLAVQKKAGTSLKSNATDSDKDKDKDKDKGHHKGGKKSKKGGKGGESTTPPPK